MLHPATIVCRAVHPLLEPTLHRVATLFALHVRLSKRANRHHESVTIHSIAVKIANVMMLHDKCSRGAVLADWVRCRRTATTVHRSCSDVSTAFAITLTNPTTPRPFLSRAGGSEGHSQEDHTFQGCHGCPWCTSSPSSQHSQCCTRGPSLRRTCTPSFPSSGDWRALYRKCMLS